jgi:phosphatidylglycerophosphate synthase/choline kinase
VSATPGVTAASGSSLPGAASRQRINPATSAILLATVTTDDGTPVAALPFRGSTVLSHLVAQLQSLGVGRVTVVTRSHLRVGCVTALGAAADRVDIVVSADSASDLNSIADLAERSSGRIVVSLGDVATHREALAGLLADPRIATGILATGRRHRQQFRVRSARGRVVSAASPYHHTSKPNGYFLGVIKVDKRHRADLVRVCRELAELRAGQLPAGWQAELDRKRDRWYGALVRRALRAEQREAGIAEPELDEFALPLSPDDEASLRRQMEFARGDVTSLVLVGLVRAGVQVNNSYLRKLFWARPLSEQQALETEERMAQIDEDKVLLDSAVKNSDGFFTTFLVSPYSRYIARWAARRGWTPNGVTVLSMALGLASAGAFATGSRPGLVVGAILLQIAFTMDCVDGQLARYTRQFSALGAWLDGTFDRAKEYAVLAGLAAGSTRGFDDDVWALAGVALALQVVRHVLTFSFGARQHQLIDTAPGLPLVNVTDKIGAPPAGPLQPDPRLAEDQEGAEADPEAEPGEAVLLPADDADERSPRSARDVVRLVARRGVRLSRLVEKLPGGRWAKKIFNFPIGERFAVISITAALWTPRITFTTMIAWGLTVGLYSTAGAVLRSARR